MHITTRRAIMILAVLGAVLLVGCSSSKPPVETEPPAAPAPTPAPTTEPEAVDEEEIVTPETAEPVVSEEDVIEELPEDLVVLNARGYLKDVFFDTDMYELREDSRSTLAENANWLRKYPSVLILVEGHCDERNTREYNLALGERRANAVRDYLVFLGINSARIMTISYGEERPFAVGSNESAWKLNRRAHFRITAH